MASILKPTANESFCNTTANTFGNSKLIRIFNSNTTGAYLITMGPNSSVNTSTITIGPSQEMLIEKWNNTDLVQCNAASQVVFAVPVAFKNN
jgi:hypothetical protein